MKKILRKFIPLLIGKQIAILHVFSPEKAHEKAFRLFCTPLSGKVRPDQEEFLEAAKDSVLKVNDLQIQTYRWPGDRETIVLVHGWDSNTHRWKRLISKLQQRQFNIIALDAPAQGNSSGKTLNVPLYTDCLEAVIQTYKPYAVVGHSVGGMTTIYHQKTYPNPAIKKLVVLGPPSELTAIIEGYQKTLGFSDAFMKSLDGYFKTNFGMYYNEFSIAAFSKALQQEGLIIHDKQDTVAPFSASVAIHKNWKNSTLIATEGLGHSLFDDTAEKAILDFLKATILT